LHRPGAFCSTLVREYSAYFQPGLKVYVNKVEVNVKKDKFSFSLVACDLCNGTEPASNYRAQLDFQFGKGEVAAMTAPTLQAAVAKVMAIDPNGAVPPGAAAAAPPIAPAAPAPAPPAAPAPPPTPEEQAPAPIPPPPPPPAEPQTISAGMTIAQVEAALGKPQKIIKVSPAKVIYLYKDLKVSFLNDKVADVE
jgi:hypothetical protein